MSPTDPRHGEYRGYVKHYADGEKPCDACRTAAARVRKRNRYLAQSGRPVTVPALGMRRRVQALQAIGWSQPRIAAAAGLSDKSLKDSLYRGESVYRSTHEAVTRAYERLSMTLPPENTSQEKRDATYSRTVAKKRGWLPPLAYDDARIDDPTYKPNAGTDRKLYRTDDLLAEVDHLARAGESVERIAQRLGVSVEAIEKARERARKKGAA